MAELNLKQITDKLNSEFAGEARKLVFWYDANADFQEDIDSLELSNAQVLHLERDNQFYTKYFLECEDTVTNYLIYAPFAKPDIRDNHLADTIRYSKEFFADRASLLALDLGIDERDKPVIQQYIKFFGNKERTQKFYDLEIESFNRGTIEVALMSVLCKNKTASFEEVLRCVLTEDGFDNNKYLAEFAKYDLLNAFWRQADNHFGYNDAKPTLEKLVMTMFVTYLAKNIQSDLPEAWKPFVSYKSGNSIAFIDNLMNSYLYGERYDKLAKAVYDAINGETYFGKMAAADIMDCSLFAEIDELLIDWMAKRLESEDFGAKLNGKGIDEVCAARRKKHFGARFKAAYFVLENAYHIIAAGVYQPISGIKAIVRDYTNERFKMDRWYRYFYYYFDQLENTEPFEQLRKLVENIYTNEYLNKITANWNKAFAQNGFDTELVPQKEFYSRYVGCLKDKIVVIISDAFRYEVAYSLFEKLQSDEKCTVTLTALQGVLPSYTALGMAALLPHSKLAYGEDFEVLVDGKSCASTEQRKAILVGYKANSDCVQFDSLKNMSRTELRAVFTGKEVVYVYHNQIDARGDTANTENEIFAACEEAIKEIHEMIKKLSSQANTYHFLVTADHGFIYKRDKLQGADKIGLTLAGQDYMGQRYAITHDLPAIDGVCAIPLGKVLGNDDSRMVACPLAADIFKVSGAGQNYVHGGCSPQEMIVPLLEVKVERGRKETSLAQIALVSLVNKITNLITTLDFVQTEPISDIVKETVYHVYFVAENNEKISNDNIVIADKKDKDTAKRMFKLRFNFKNKQYNKSEKYYLVAYDAKSGLEVFRHEIVMDIAFADDFGFFG